MSKSLKTFRGFNVSPDKFSKVFLVLISEMYSSMLSAFGKTTLKKKLYFWRFITEVINIPFVSEQGKRGFKNLLTDTGDVTLEHIGVETTSSVCNELWAEKDGWFWQNDESFTFQTKK